jgi:hypothetical protein
MDSQTEAMPVTAAAPVSASTWKERLFATSFLTACAVAMIGWLVGFSWLAIATAKWLFF